MILLLFAFLCPAIVGATCNVLIYFNMSGGAPCDGNSASAVTNVIPVLQALGANVTTIGVCSPAYDPTVDNWVVAGVPQYNQIWDMRFEDVTETACPFAPLNDNFNSFWQTNATAYLNACGNFYLQGENDAYFSRNSSNITWLDAIGATGGAFNACAFGTATSNGYGTLGSPIASTLPGAAQFEGFAVGGIPPALIGLGTSYVQDSVAGDWIDGRVRDVVVGWQGAAQMTSLNAGSNGRLLTVWDTTMWQGVYYSGNTAVVNTFYDAVYNWLGCTNNCTTTTPTNTATMTSTQTPTNTATVTDTNTPTNTVTNTATTTPTQTPTNSSTATVTNSPTNTATDTSTATTTQTPTNTTTSTDTNTSTNTATETATNTSTSTVTNTSTNTTIFTPTNTTTNTSTNTATASATNTATSTVTFTPTAFIGFGKSASQNTAHAGDTITYDVAVTIGGGSPLNGVVITDLLPANVAFLSFAPTTPASTTVYTSSTGVLQWTFPAPMAPGVYHFTYQTQLNSLIVGNPAIVNHAQLSYTGLASPLNASAPVTLIGQFTVKVNIYNSAGEIVKTIPVQQFSEPINSISLSTSDTITTLKGAGSSIDIIFAGVIIGTWDGSDNSNNPVSNGSYHIQIDSVGTSGVVTSVSQNAIVNRSLSKIEIDIYNSAGEVVRHLYDFVDDSSSTQMTNVTLGSNVIKPGSVSPGEPSTVQILAQTSSAPVTVVWDGTADGGGWVTPGEYQVEVHWNNGSGSTTDITRSVLVLSNNGITGNVVARPNVLNTVNGFTTTFDASGVQNASSIKVNIYTIAGELVQNMTSASGMPVQPWSPVGLASGIYLANVEVHNANGGVVNRQFVKVLLLH